MFVSPISIGQLTRGNELITRGNEIKKTTAFHKRTEKKTVVFLFRSLELVTHILKLVTRSLELVT